MDDPTFVLNEANIAPARSVPRGAPWSLQEINALDKLAGTIRQNQGEGVEANLRDRTATILNRATKAYRDGRFGEFEAYYDMAINAALGGKMYGVAGTMMDLRANHHGRQDPAEIDAIRGDLGRLKDALPDKTPRTQNKTDRQRRLENAKGLIDEGLKVENPETARVLFSAALWQLRQAGDNEHKELIGALSRFDPNGDVRPDDIDSDWDAPPGGEPPRGGGTPEIATDAARSLKEAGVLSPMRLMQAREESGLRAEQALQMFQAWESAGLIEPINRSSADRNVFSLYVPADWDMSEEDLQAALDATMPEGIVETPRSKAPKPAQRVKGDGRMSPAHEELLNLLEKKDDQIDGWSRERTENGGSGAEIWTNDATKERFIVKDDPFWAYRGDGNAEIAGMASHTRREEGAYQVLAAAGVQSPPAKYNPNTGLAVVAYAGDDDPDVVPGSLKEFSMLKKSQLGKVVRDALDPDDWFRIAMFDAVSGNPDRHDGNLLVAERADGRFSVFPIDHGLIGTDEKEGNGIGNLNEDTIHNDTMPIYIQMLRDQGLSDQQIKQDLARKGVHFRDLVELELGKTINMDLPETQSLIDRLENFDVDDFVEALFALYGGR
jgi:hypothetical protein